MGREGSGSQSRGQGGSNRGLARDRCDCAGHSGHTLPVICNRTGRRRCRHARNQPQGFKTMQKWQNTNAGPIQCKRFNGTWSKLNWEDNTYVDLIGVIGQSERRCVLTTMGTAGNREDVTAVKEAIGAQFAWTITAQNVNEITKALADALVILEQNRPVHDNRTTPAEDTARNEERARMAAEQKAKGDRSAAAFVAHYGNGEKVTSQPGQMVIVAQVCFDNSDSMSDYFDRQASLSQSFALLVVSKQAETERLARRGVSVSSLLAGIEFYWHTEKYSMGPGNYLESKGGFELPADLQGLREGYRIGGVTHAHWEITFQHVYREPFTLDAIAGYGQIQLCPQGSTPEPVLDVTISENEEKDGIEISFPSKPSTNVLESLKANGWRWSRFSSCWYTKRSDKARQFAEALGGQSTTNTPTERLTSRREVIPDDVIGVLQQADFDCDSVKISGQLDRDLYLKVNKTLEAVGGKWNRERKCHVFAQNPRDVLGIEEGKIKPVGMSGEAITRVVEQGTQGKVFTNLFPTPPSRAARMVEEAGIDPRHPCRVLQPSAGTGALIDALPDTATVHCVEISNALCRRLNRSEERRV